jgi:hypothetical protein
MSLNKFTNTSTGFDLQLDIGCDEIKANNVITDNIDTTTINGLPPGGGSGVQNPLTSDLKLGGFAIIEPLASLSPGLNIDQLDTAKKIDLKVGGVAKVVVKNGEVELKENLNMNQKQINDVSLITNTTAPLGLVGSTGTTAVVLDPDPANSFNVLGQSDIRLISNTDVILQSNTGFVDLNSNITRVNVGGVPKLQVDASETTSSNNINMGDNEIQNLGKITSSADLTLTPTGNVIATSNLDMTSNQIDNVTRLDSGLSNAILSVVGRDRVDIGVPGATRLEVENSRVYISQFANLNLGDKIVWVKANEMPSGGVFQPDTTYVFVGSRTTSSSFTLPENCKICGTGKNNSFINYTGATSLFISNDNNLSICEITLTSSDNAGRILSAINLGQDKTIDMTRVQLRNCKNGMTIVGYDLVDLNNCIFTFFESGSLTPIGINFNDNSKVQLSSCEFLRWFQEGGVPASTFFNGSMLKFGGALNALNLNGCFFHPQYDQDGINLSALLSAIEGTITSNTFIDINLNTPTFQVLVPPIASLASKYVIESNSIYPNLKSQVTYVLSAVNTLATDLSVNNPNVINHNNLALPLAIQFSTITPGGLITYTKKRSANFMIVATCNLELVSGTNNRIGLGLFVNGSEVPLAYSYVNLSASGSANQKSATLSFTGQANQNDTFQLSVFNATAANNVIVNDINFAGIEI